MAMNCVHNSITVCPRAAADHMTAQSATLHSHRAQVEPAWPSGKAFGWWAEGPRFDSTSALLSLQKLWSVDTVDSVT